jgi:Tfp pilus assembly protein PilV
VIRHFLRTLGHSGNPIEAHRRRAARATHPDSGISLVEVIVAVVLLTIVSLVVVRLVIQTGASSSQSRYRVEATNVAEQEIESLQNLSSFGNLSAGQQALPPVTVTENGGNHSQIFNITATYALQDDVADGGNSACTNAQGSTIPPSIWNVTVNVSWGGTGESVTEGTYLAPEAGGSIPETSGELVVPIENSLLGPYATSVPVSVIGVWAGSGTEPTVPGNETISPPTASTGTSGCAVFQGLDPAAGFQYEVSIGTQGGPTYTGAVTQQEVPGVVDGSTATKAAFSEGPYFLTYGTATVATQIIMSPGVQVPVSFVTQTSSSCNTTCAANALAAADLPVTVEATPQLTGANNTAVFDTSTAPTQITSMTLFPLNDYECWAGDTPDSNPAYAIGSGPPVYPGLAAQSCDTTTSPSATLAVYPVVIKATYVPAAPVPTVTATEVLAPNHTIALNPFPGTPVSPATSSSGLPLGAYQLGYEVGASANTVISEWIWVTPTGVYSSILPPPAAGPTGMGTPASPGTAIAVTL